MGNAEQSITLTGLGLDCFERYVRGVLAIHGILASHLAGHTLGPWKPSHLNGDLVLKFSSQYFAHPREAKGRISQPLGKDVDPSGVMAKRITTEVHLEENQVEYYQCVSRE